MGLELDYLPGQTPLDEDEIHGLLIPTIATRQELDEFEQHNIEQAIEWTLMRSFKPEQIFTEAFVCDVHKRMYGDVWAWAGEFRKTEKNIGIDKWKIGPELKILLDDAAYWIKNNVYAPDEIAVRFKHRIVSIHCFPNGNGRHSRLMADIIAEKVFKQPVFTWGAENLVRQGDTRSNYLTAVKAADAGDIAPLMAFARS
jgi:Fic-DOC domain mobile mystery protein B